MPSVSTNFSKRGDLKMNPVIKLTNVSKRYGDVHALKNISLSIKKGEIFTIIGPNGAGKTTMIECIMGLRKPDIGEVTVLDVDVKKDAKKIKEHIGVQLQTTLLYDRIKVREALQLFSSYYKKQRGVDEIIELLSLGPYEKKYVKKLSGGWRQRVALGLALVNDPQILILDEPSTGLDPKARHDLWEIILSLKEEGKTIILSTHYMEEAHALSDRVALIFEGTVRALGTPEQLIAQLPNGHGSLNDFYLNEVTMKGVGNEG